MTRSTVVKIKLLADWKGIPKGTTAKARTIGFGCKILEGEHQGVELGKHKYKVLKVLPETREQAV
ncbi:hypothetical protein [Rheinheimera fenheensis]|uniref:hypothetical protein n=1 Tax=Rheinheimera fenheensis TaxID=3152295 RepID=UPI0032605924